MEKKTYIFILFMTFLIPIKSQAQLTPFAFFSKAPVISACGGVLIGGFCWYLGDSSKSCTHTCSGHGGYNDATKTYAGSAGTRAQCKSVLNALGQGGSVTDIGFGCTNTGCYAAFTGLKRCTANATDAGSIASFGERACACNN